MPFGKDISLLLATALTLNLTVSCVSGVVCCWLAPELPGSFDTLHAEAKVSGFLSEEKKGKGRETETLAT